MRTGLVLGGGGLPGASFHAGALMALEVDLGWDPRSADVIVGTSAGALAAMMLRLGMKTMDLAGFMSGVRRHVEHPLLLDGGLVPPVLPPTTWTDLMPRRRSAGDKTTFAPTRLVGDPRIRYLQMLGAGRVDFRQHLAFAGESWPEGALKVCAVRASDFTRVVWDRDSGVALATAVAGSCSMPGYARAVPVDGHDHFDGGLWSPTNADVLVGEDLDLVVVLSPMTPTGRPGPVVQRWADGRLAREIAVLEKAGSRVEVIRSPRTTARRAAQWSSATGTTPGRHLGESFLGAGAQLSQLRSFLRS